ncbi:MAG: uroporphyrinogen decarboxylase family protein [Promethearchaeia archaeon]
MKSKERVKRAFHFNKPDRVPMSCISLKTDFFPVMQFEPKTWQPKNYPPHVQGGAYTMSSRLVRWVVYNWKKKYRKKAGYSKKWWKYPHTGIDEWGVLWQSSGIESEDKTMGHPFQGPLQENWDDLDAFETPDAADPSRYRLVKSKIMKFLGRNRYTLGTYGSDGLFTKASQIRGFNNLLIDFARNPKKVEKLIAKILPYYKTQAEKYKEYFPSLDSMVMADDFGTQKSPFLSPRVFKKFFFEPFKELSDLIHNLGMDFILHSCGDVGALIPQFIDIGIDVVEFDSPHMTGVENFKHYAKEKKLAFWLSSNIQTTYVKGTPEEVEEEIKYYIKEVGNNEGGLAIYEYPQNYSLGTPKENIKAQREAVLKWGNYDENHKIEWLD